jgi:hypothetical protein
MCTPPHIYMYPPPHMCIEQSVAHVKQLFRCIHVYSSPYIHVSSSPYVHRTVSSARQAALQVHTCVLPRSLRRGSVSSSPCMHRTVRRLRQAAFQVPVDYVISYHIVLYCIVHVVCGVCMCTHFSESLFFLFFCASAKIYGHLLRTGEGTQSLCVYSDSRESPTIICVKPEAGAGEGPKP